MDQTVHKCIGVFIVWKLPYRPIQPERSVRNFGQVDISPISEIFRWQMWHEYAWLERDAQKLAFRPLAFDGRRFRLRPAHREHRLALVSRHNHFPVTCSLRDNVPVRSLCVRQIRSTNGESDGLSSTVNRMLLPPGV